MSIFLWDRNFGVLATGAGVRLMWGCFPLTRRGRRVFEPLVWGACVEAVEAEAVALGLGFRWGMFGVSSARFVERGDGLGSSRAVDAEFCDRSCEGVEKSRFPESV